MAGISHVGAFMRRLGYRERIALAVLIGLVIRVALAVGDDVITNDASAYLRSGESLWSGDGFRGARGRPELHFPPLYPAILGGLNRLFDDPHRAMVTATLVASSTLLLLVASLARRLGGDRAAVAAVWVGALAPGLTDVPVSAGSGNEVWFVLLVLAAVRLALLAHDRAGPTRHLAALASGGVVGIAYLTRPEGLLYAPVAMAVLIAPIIVLAAGDRVSRAFAAGCIGLGVLVALPYASYLHSNTGSWELTAKTNDASMESWQAVADHDRRARDAVVYELADDGVSFAAGSASLAELARDDPAGYADIVATNVGQLVDEVAETVEREHIDWGWALLPLPVSALALWGAWRLRRRPSVWLLLTALLLPTMTALAFFVQVRYLIPATAFVCILAGLAFAELRGVASRIAMAVGLVLLVWSLLASVDGSDGFLNRREPVEHRLVGQWIIENTPSDARVMTRSMIAEYYADRRAVPIPYATPDEVLTFAEHHGVDYIVADSFTFDDLRPQLVEWIEGSPPEGYEVAYELERSGRRLRVLQRAAQNAAETVDPPGIGFMGDG